MFPLRLYDVRLHAPVFMFNGHHDLVYDTAWSSDSTLVATASSDGTVKVWDTVARDATAAVVMQHPSFVYAVRFHPAHQGRSILITGAYDARLRVWRIDPTNENAPRVILELRGHARHINCIELDPEGERLFTADGNGSVRMWNVNVSPEADSDVVSLTCSKVFDDRDLLGDPINCLRLHPGGRRLLVHCRNNILRMIDLRLWCVAKTFSGAKNTMYKLACDFSPDGRFIAAGSEDASVHVWNTDTADPVAVLDHMPLAGAVSAVQWHPHDDLLMLGAFGHSDPVTLWMP